jgi:DNA repair protein SbcD/Mre11
MRLLHTSDWHLGKVTYNQSRWPDHDAVHREIVAIAKDVRPDLILHTGDLFDAAFPAVQDMKRGIEMIDELAAITPIVVLCGNHDSPKLFEVFGLLRGHHGRVRFIDRARSPSAGGILTYETSGGERIRLAPLPFVRDTRFVGDFADLADWSSVYADRLAGIERILAQGLADGYDASRDVLLFAAHLFVEGSILARSERRVHIDNFSTRAEAIPPVTYAAFGHIHHPQALPGRPWARYAGSPIPIDFGEVDEGKSVVVLEVAPGRAADPQTIPLSGGRPLRRETGTLGALAARADALRGALALVTVETERPTPMLFEAVKEMLPETTVLDVQERCASSTVAPVERSNDGVDERPLPELFAAYLHERGLPDADNRSVLAMFEALAAKVAQDEKPSLDELRGALETR